MLPEPISLGDVLDVENFVGKTLRRSRIRFASDEFDELLCEGIAIMYQLNSKWDGRGRFSGYAAAYLPKRLGAAWHRLHPEHVEVTDHEGRRRFEYLEPPTSYEGHLEARDGIDGSGRDGRELRFRSAGDFVRAVPSYAPA